MEIVRQPAAPVEMINLTPWLAFIAALFAPHAQGAVGVPAVDAIAALLRGEPARLILYGNGALVAASEYNLDLLRSIITTVSGRFGGGLDGDLPTPSIRYHPALHRCDVPRLIAAAEREPDTAFFIVAVDTAIEDWPAGGLLPSAGLPHPALALLRWLHSEWQLSDVAERLAVIERWAQAGVQPALKVIT